MKRIDAILTNTEHAVAGATIAAGFRLIGFLPGWLFWPLCALASFLSHFLVDAIPHGHSFVLGKDTFKENKKGFWLEAGPGILFIIIVFPLIIKIQGVFYFIYYFWGMFWANVPDALALKFNLFQRLNNRCHWFNNKKLLKSNWRQYFFRQTLILIWLYFFLS